MTRRIHTEERRRRARATGDLVRERALEAHRKDTPIIDAAFSRWLATRHEDEDVECPKWRARQDASDRDPESLDDGDCAT